MARFPNAWIFSIRRHSRCFHPVCVEILSASKQIMTNEVQSIEVEVLEIDGAEPPAKFETREEIPPPSSWRDWQGRVRRLDGRWWPLWVLLGAVALVLLLTLGLVIGIILVVLKILGNIIRAISR